MIWIIAIPSPFKQVEAHLVETIFYDEWAPSGESLVSKLLGTFVPRWEDVENELKSDFRELLARKRKRKEVPTSESGNLPRYVRVKTLGRQNSIQIMKVHMAHLLCASGSWRRAPT